MRGNKAGLPGAMAGGESDLGALAVAVTGGEVIGVSFGNRDQASALKALSLKLSGDGHLSDPGDDASEEDLLIAEEVLEQLQRFAAGEPVELKQVAVSLDHLTTFQRRVVKACRAIKRGERRSYGEVAAIAGSPGAARAVGQVMRTNHTPLIVPCHRVVAAGGKLGGFSAPDGLAMKKRLLALESDGLFEQGARVLTGSSAV